MRSPTDSFFPSERYMQGLEYDVRDGNTYFYQLDMWMFNTAAYFNTSLFKDINAH